MLWKRWLYHILLHRRDTICNSIPSPATVRSRAKLNKSENLVTNTTAASKNIPKRPRICINWNQTSLHKFFENCFHEVNLTSQQSHLEIYLLSKCWSESGDFNYADSGRLSFVLWCCGSICHQVFTLFRLAVAILWLHDLCFFFLPFLTCKVEMISRKIKVFKNSYAGRRSITALEKFGMVNGHVCKEVI